MSSSPVYQAAIREALVAAGVYPLTPTGPQSTLPVLGFCYGLWRGLCTSHGKLRGLHALPLDGSLEHLVATEKPLRLCQLHRWEFAPQEPDLN